MMVFLSARLPIRTTACNTTASTAHLRPKNRPRRCRHGRRARRSSSRP
jgi:hypothetical protein